MTTHDYDCWRREAMGPWGLTDFWGLVRPDRDQEFSPVTALNFPWTSPTLGIRFEVFSDGLAIFHPNGEPFKDSDTLFEERDRAFAKLRELGIDPAAF